MSMNRRGLVSKRRLPWGQSTNSSSQGKMLLDFTALDRLGEVVLAFEASNAPSLEDLLTMSSAIIGKSRNSRNKVNHNDYNMAEELNEIESDQSVRTPNDEPNEPVKKRLRTNRWKSMLSSRSSRYSSASLGPSVSISRKNIDEDIKSRSHDFFMALRQQFTTQYPKVAKCVADSIQRYLRGEISEMAMLIIMKYLLADNKQLLELFQDFTRVFTADKNTKNYSSVMETMTRYADMPYLKADKASSRLMVDASPVIPSRKEQASNFLQAIKASIDENSYERFLDLLVGLRASYRMGRLHTINERMLIIKSLLPQNRYDLKTQLDLLFPVEKLAYIRETSLQSVIIPNINADSMLNVSPSFNVTLPPRMDQHVPNIDLFQNMNLPMPQIQYQDNSRINQSDNFIPNTINSTSIVQKTMPTPNKFLGIPAEVSRFMPLPAIPSINPAVADEIFQEKKEYSNSNEVWNDLLTPGLGKGIARKIPKSHFRSMVNDMSRSNALLSSTQSSSSRDANPTSAPAPSTGAKYLVLPSITPQGLVYKQVSIDEIATHSTKETETITNEVQLVMESSSNAVDKTSLDASPLDNGTSSPNIPVENVTYTTTEETSGNNEGSDTGAL